MSLKRMSLFGLAMMVLMMITFVPAQAQQMQYPAQYHPIFQPWPPIIDYQQFVDDSSNELFGRTGMALTQAEAVTASQSMYVGTALFQESDGSVTSMPFSFVVDEIKSTVVDVYEDPASGSEVDVTLTTLDGTLSTSIGTVNATIGAVSATLGALEGHYINLIAPNGRTLQASSSKDSFYRYATQAAAGGEEDPCDGCISDHNNARNKAKRRHKRCRNKALIFGGGATLIASFSGPWGTAGGLLGTAAAVDACNDTLADAKEDAVGAYCECWASNGCAEDDDNYEDNCS